jgi:hypothetical protein
MKRFTLIPILIIAAFGAWAVWTYATTEDTVREIAARLPAEHAARADRGDAQACRERMRTRGAAQGKPFGRPLRGDEIKSLAEHCELIKARPDALDGP